MVYSIPHATPSLETEDDGGEITDRESDKATFLSYVFADVRIRGVLISAKSMEGTEFVVL